jgi:hypothetical protein
MLHIFSVWDNQNFGSVIFSRSTKHTEAGAEEGLRILVLDVALIRHCEMESI